MNGTQQTYRLHAERVVRHLRPLLAVVLTLWLIEAVDWMLFNGALDRLGIVPRTSDGLRGVIFAPFLHGGFSHLLANTIPFITLGWLISLRHNRDLPAISVVILVISGLGTWLTAPADTVHIGASGLIFGYFAFLIVNAYYERSLAAVLLAVLVILVYGSLILGALPADGISWQGHLFGLVGGGLAAYYLESRRPRDQ